jgi:hypothetical protein
MDCPPVDNQPALVLLKSVLETTPQSLVPILLNEGVNALQVECTFSKNYNTYFVPILFVHSFA